MNEHGSYQMALRGQVLVINIHGAWNLETTQRWCLEYMSLADTLKKEPWACFVDLTEWELSTPECIACIDRVNDWGNLNNQKYEAVICRSLLQQKILKQMHQRLPNVQTEFFQDEDQAWQWLQEEGIAKVSP